MATLIDKQLKSNIQSMLGIIALQVEDNRLKEAEENLKTLTKVISNARNEMNGLDLDSEVIRFDIEEGVDLGRAPDRSVSVKFDTVTQKVVDDE